MFFSLANLGVKTDPGLLGPNATPDSRWLGSNQHIHKAYTKTYHLPQGPISLFVRTYTAKQLQTMYYSL